MGTILVCDEIVSNMSESYFISGIQQIGVGCVNFREAWNWYIKMFHMDVRILEDDTVAERMLPYTGGKAQKRHACIAVNLQGGGGFEIWQYSERVPVPCGFDVSVGDLGTFAAKLKSRDVEAFHSQLLEQRKVEGGKAEWMLGPIYISPDGVKTFVVEDPWHNYFYIEERKDIFIEQHTLNGGISGAMVGCTDISKSLSLYSDVLGYDTVVYDQRGQFADLASMRCGHLNYRRVKLKCSKSRKGAFVPLLGDSTIELIQPQEREPRRIYEGRQWGDPGFIQICFDVTNMRALEKACNEKGYHFTVDSCPNDEHFDMGEASGHFTYIEDPDGNLIELVEAHKLTVLKRPHIYINMLSRNRERAFPKVFFWLMGMNKVK